MRELEKKPAEFARELDKKVEKNDHQLEKREWTYNNWFSHGLIIEVSHLPQPKKYTIDKKKIYLPKGLAVGVIAFAPPSLDPDKYKMGTRTEAMVHAIKGFSEFFTYLDYLDKMTEEEKMIPLVLIGYTNEKLAGISQRLGFYRQYVAYDREDVIGLTDTVREKLEEVKNTKFRGTPLLERLEQRVEREKKRYQIGTTKDVFLAKPQDLK